MSKFADKLKTDHDEDEEQQEYEEVNDPKHIKAILRAELEGKNQPSSTTFLNQNPLINQNSLNQTNKQNQDKASRKEKPQFIKDDRQRETPHQFKEKAQKQQQQDKPKKDNQKQINSEREKNYQKTQSNKKYVSKEDINRNVESHLQNNKQKDYLENKKYVEKSKTKDINQIGRQENNKPSRVKYEEKKGNGEQSQQATKPKRQFYEQKGEEIELELIDQWKDFDNSIYVGKKDPQIYVQKAQEMLKVYNYILLKSFAIYVEKAFLVAGLLAEKYPRLKQISIPSTVEVFMISKSGEKRRSRGAIEIELTLKQKQLDQNHIGYQLANAGSQKQKKIEYKQKQIEKRQEKKTEKKVNYVEKKGRRSRTKSEEQQEQRELR